MHTAMLSRYDIKYRIREEGNTVSVQCSNSPLLVKNNAIQLCNEHWYLSVKNTEVHDRTLNVITAIKLSDTDNMVVIGSDVNLLILLSKRSHHSNAKLCKPTTGDIYRTIQPSQWLPEH